MQKEQEIINRISENVKTPIDAKAIKFIFKEIFNFQKENIEK